MANEEIEKENRELQLQRQKRHAGGPGGRFISSDEKAAELGIPAAVKLRETDVLQGKKIGNSICYKGDEWCAALAGAMEALGAYYGAEITVEDGDLNDETQTKQIENMMANGVDIMMIDPITPDGSGEALTQAHDAEIPIIIYDGYWTDGEEKALTFSVEII